MATTPHDDDCPVCFGDAAKCGRVSQCKRCVYRKSCDYCATESKFKIGGNAVYDDCRGRDSISEDEVAFSDDHSEPRSYSSEEMQDMIRYLLMLDDSLLAILLDIFSHPDIKTTAALARLYGISRQAMHKKVFALAMKYPELSYLLMSKLHRVKVMRKAKAKFNSRLEAAVCQT